MVNLVVYLGKPKTLSPARVKPLTPKNAPVVTPFVKEVSRFLSPKISASLRADNPPTIPEIVSAALIAKNLNHQLKKKKINKYSYIVNCDI